MMFLLTQSSNNIALLNLANIGFRQRNAQTALEKNAAKKNNNRTAFKEIFSRLFTGLNINNEEVQKITGAAVFTRVRPEIMLLKNKSTSGMLLFHCQNLNMLRLSAYTSHGLQSKQFHTRAAKRSATIGGGTRQQIEQNSIWSNFIKWSKKDKTNFDQYKADLEKLDENGRKVYNEAFIKGGFFGQREPTIKDHISNYGRKFIAFILIGTTVYMILKVIAKSGIGVGGVSFDIVGASDLFTMEQEVNVTFDDVCGIEEAKLEVQEIVEYLRNPNLFTRLGARLPKGVLLVGPPGTGKTLLARAIAGEASVPFFHTSGSEFDEVLVGQGAKRVRELFKKARQNAPCVVFIDEIDSVGAKRTSSAFHPYANQTINQLLAEMDGFVQNEGVIVIGATNKKDHLDSALLRPGRFDVHVNVTIPDLSGRKEIFQLYLDKIIHGDCNAEKLAKGTYGFTGADIENMVNQAALKAASENLSKVHMRHLDEARDRILMGPARLKGRFPDEEANRNTAYHEAGHAIVAMFTKYAHPLHKVTIIPRGAALGHTAQLPEKDQLQMTKAQMLAELDVSMGGRVAEELIFGEENITTGASSDLKKATSIAESMVKAFGMSDRVGLRDFTTTMNEMELGTYGRGPHTSDEIDAEIRRVLQESYDRAKELLLKYKNEHRLLAEALLEYETLNKQEVERVIKGDKLKKLMPNQVKTPSGTGIRGRKQPVNAGTFIPDRRTTD